MDLLIATGNPGKVREYDELLAGIPVTCIRPADVGIDLKVSEGGATYHENAVLKAETYARAGRSHGIWLTLADDSGLEVDALKGRPGVHSARYGRPDFNDADRWRLLLQELEGVPWEQRTARFRCVIALATADGRVATVEGVCEGRIALHAAGTGGFGYDPVFYLPGQNCTMAQLPKGVKSSISHRAHAARAAIPIIAQLIHEMRGQQGMP
jgi:XTP/dITP diphosphohydrolase